MQSGVGGGASGPATVSQSQLQGVDQRASKSAAPKGGFAPEAATAVQVPGAAPRPVTNEYIEDAEGSLKVVKGGALCPNAVSDPAQQGQSICKPLLRPPAAIALPTQSISNTRMVMSALRQNRVIAASQQAPSRTGGAGHWRKVAAASGWKPEEAMRHAFEQLPAYWV